MEDMDYYEWEESKKRFTPTKIIKFVFKAIAFIIIAGTFALLFGRMALMKTPKAFTGVTLTDQIAACIEDGTFSAVYQEPIEPYNDNGRDENGKEQKGWYHVSNIILSEETKEVQLTVRYNSRSTINTLMQKGGLTERPAGEVFIYILSDGNGNTYTDYIFAAKSRPLYEFRRVIFTDVDLSDVKTLTLDVYYGEDVSENGLMHATFDIYNSEYGGDILGADAIQGKGLTFSKAPAYISSLENDEK